MTESWTPTAKLETLKTRAEILQKIRHFFAARGILEVETPILSQYTVTDPYIESFSTQDVNGDTYYLQTSPEYAMKRLLAAGSGPIYQITKSFRKEEQGRFHNPEFTMLEWYRPEFNHHDLMDEVDALLQTTLATPKATQISYQQLFQQYLNIDPFATTQGELKKIISAKIPLQNSVIEDDLDECLQLLLTHCIEPHLGFDAPLFLYDFPPKQAALARIRAGTPSVAERFELYIQGTEIANGFHELANVSEQQARFEENQRKRKQLQKFIPEIDTRFIDALQYGLPNCAGVALGIDRLMMFKTRAHSLQNIMSFAWENA